MRRPGSIPAVDEFEAVAGAFAKCVRAYTENDDREAAAKARMLSFTVERMLRDFRKFSR